MDCSQPASTPTLFATSCSLSTPRFDDTAACGWSQDQTIDPKMAECLKIAAVFTRDCIYSATIHHGIVTDDFAIHPNHGDHLLFLAGSTNRNP